MELLDEDTNVFKLVGPVLVKQELSGIKLVINRLRAVTCSAPCGLIVPVLES